jgi:hypothetical protein
MTTPAAMAMASLTVMLWILWSDSLRKRKPSQIVYTVRIALYLIVSGVLVLNMVRYPALFFGYTRLVAILAVIVGIAGAAYFARKLVTRAGGEKLKIEN